jgi:hypothetical protein
MRASLRRLGAGERGLQAVVQCLGDALVVVRGELGHGVRQLVARHGGGREVAAYFFSAAVSQAAGDTAT